MSGNTFIRFDGTGTPDDPLRMAIGAELENFAEEAVADLKDAIEGAAQAAVDVLRSVSPYRRGSGRGHYRSGWRFDLREQDMTYSAVVYNKNKPTLTHLLQRGHNVVRKGRVFGFVAAKPHLDQGYQAAAEYLAQRGWAA